MKVLMTADPIGGVWTFALEMAQGLASRGVGVSLAVEGRALTDSQEAQLRALPLDGWWSTRRKVEWMPDPWDDVEATGSWLQEIAEVVQPDIVHSNSFSHASLGWTQPVVVTAHSCVLSWWRSVKNEDAPPEWNAYERRVNDGLNGADAIVAPTKAFLDDLAEIYRFDTSSHVVPNGLEAAPPKPHMEKNELILGAGRLWDEAKNIALLERVAEDLPWPVTVIGEGGGSAAGVTYTGALSHAEVQQWMERASLFCAPARYEPFGLSPLEAAIRGCALVLGDIATLREVWGEAAVFVDPDDASALHDACTRLIEDAELRDQMRTRAEERAKIFTRTQMVEGYLRLYSVLDGRVAAPVEVAAR